MQLKDPGNSTDNSTDSLQENSETSHNQKADLEIWAGIECTVNRVGDLYFDQLERNGHANRIEDLERIASLGVKALRYPVLWERIAPNGIEQADWSWADERLAALRNLQIRPIVGLVHHGSGPLHTSLIDPSFAEKLAEFAAAVAQRYPWIQDYTPVNEPLTTARFSGLYGHWYPHGRDEQTFIRALLHECRAVVLSMQAIRRINPAARLVQTEDLGRVLSTPLLTYQAQFENDRRWLSLDLLCGRVDRAHPLWNYLCTHVGIDEAELAWFQENPCPPDIVGINRYLTSDRFLDERLDRYPSQSHGGNGIHQYADVEAVRVCAEGIWKPEAMLEEAWNRYQLPVAVTEVHLSCTREEQLRWFKEIWDAAHHVRNEGAEIRAVTAWSVLGAYDWNSLVTQDQGFYESGVFDLRAPSPRLTALAAMVRHLANGQTYDHPVLDTPGWWRRSQRLVYPPVSCEDHSQTSIESHLQPSTPPLLITGATGTLGGAIARLCEIRGISYRLVTRQELDITDAASIDRALSELKPWAVINAAGYVRVDQAESEPQLCRRINAEGAAILAKACLQHNTGYVTFSSDLVFDGNQSQPYVESSKVAPLNTYGQSKAIAEQWVLSMHPCSLVIRTSAFFSPWDDYNFCTIALRTLASGEKVIAADDAIVSPTYVPDLVNATLDLLIDGESGLWHLANAGEITWANLAKQVATLAGFDPYQVEARPTHTLGFSASRPIYSALSSDRGILLPSLDHAIDCYLANYRKLATF